MFENVGIRIVWATLFPVSSFAYLLWVQSFEVNIFLKFSFCLCILDNVRKDVANQVLAGLSKFLCLVNYLIMFMRPVQLYIYPVSSIALFNVLMIVGSFAMSSNIKSKQWAAHGVQYKWGLFASNNHPNNVKI